jgi:urease accessory protein UreH
MEGDDHHTLVKVYPSAKLFLGPQSNTRILPCENGGKVSLTLGGTVYANACCVLAGDPTVLYKDSRFALRHRWKLDPTARFLIMDAWTAGRLGRGERFDFDSLDSHLRVENLEGIPLHTDSFRVCKKKGFSQFGSMACQLNLWAWGPEMNDLETYLGNWLRVSPTAGGRPRWNEPGLLVGMGHRPGRGLGLKALARTRSDFDALIGAVFEWVSKPEWLGGNPWARKF